MCSEKICNITFIIYYILTVINKGDLAALAVLDLTAAFDTVDHKILLQRLQSRFGVTGRLMAWIRSYLYQRTLYVHLGSCGSRPQPVFSSVPEESVLGTILFLIYIADLPCVIQCHGFQLHLYADETQIYDLCSPSSTDQLQLRLSDCIDDVANWMRSNQLLLNTEKTEVLWCSSNRRQHLLPPDTVRVGSNYVKPSSSVRDLGICLDSGVSM